MFKKSLFMMLILSCFCLDANWAWAADPLLLTPEEIQKLKKYFPSTATDSPSSEKSTPSSVQDHAPAATTTQSDSSNTAETSISSPTQNDPTLAMSEGDTYVALTRYAWQQLYAPTQLLRNPLSIHRVSMQANSLESNLVYGDKVIAHPLASWSLNDVYITAVSLRNQYPHPATIHTPQDICGNWVGTVIYPRDHLSAMGDKYADSTTLFLLSRKPFNQASEVCHVSA